MSEIQFDHVIALLPYKDIVDPPEWVTKNFTLSPGGKHADGRTENRLILFKDGTYLELIAFINDDEEKRSGHWWDTSFGVVDYALTTAGPFDFDDLKHRMNKANSFVQYEGPLSGARTRPDGVEIKWQLMFPNAGKRGEVPFWCHDKTPRNNRVPITPENTTHPCGTTGVGGMVLNVNKSDSDRVGSALNAIFGSQENSMSTPIDSGTGKKPAVRVAVDDGPSQASRLSLILQVKGPQAPADIEEGVGGGHVSIRFEKVE